MPSFHPTMEWKMYLRAAAVPNIPAGAFARSWVSNCAAEIADWSSVTSTKTFVASGRRCLFHASAALPLS